LNWGEGITSLRQLLRRQCLSQVRVPVADTTHVNYIWSQTMGRWPLVYGFDPTGLDTAKGLVVTGSNFQFNFCEFHPITYIMTAFVGTRGSIMWNFNFENTGAIETIRICRLPYSNSTPTTNVVSAATNGTQSVNSSFYTSVMDGGNGGCSLTNQLTQSGLAVSLPNYTNYKFQQTTPSNASFLNTDDGSAYDGFRLQMSMNGLLGPTVAVTKIWQYCGIGTDFTVHFFLNVPTMFSYATFPIAV